ncbi:MAG: ferrochelatase [Brevundimonas sp.]|uniref:ferrochelatase n=1 Tax=Brevundimonas sp. TaxID=1871086 RepID=UPI002734CAA7|nr:ferrochelatase [Brevundimonas sp.]MDP3656436.1 ferrochelatase [Brevundimonas sp.]MDZ4112605.1 ferrochelatase [Brevundimonas sp.]
MTGVPAGRRVAVVLFNLGGPDDQASVRPFLFNLFNDPAIIGLPNPFRTVLARLISSRREASAQANYALMGGGSPLLPETRRQAGALEQALRTRLRGDEIRVFIAMRYWSPLTEQTAAEVGAFAPDEIVLLPLYPQFSTTTTESSLKRWAEVYAGSGASRTVCCYPEAAGWIEAQAEGVKAKLAEAGDRPVRVLFSAHGIPESLVARKGDPYQEQIGSTCAAIAARAGLTDWSICYQSRVGPMKWLGPSTPEAIAQAGRDGVGVIVTPVAFVSEHIETLVELDIEYAELAHELGVAPYLRAPAVGLAASFIGALADATVEALGRTGVAPFGPGCRADWKACPCQKERRAA